jgi:hypothetical protein
VTGEAAVCVGLYEGRAITIPRDHADALRRAFTRGARKALDCLQDPNAGDSTERRALTFEAERCLASMPIPSKAEVAAGEGPLRLYVSSRSEALERLADAIEADMQGRLSRKALDRIIICAGVMRALRDVPSHRAMYAARKQYEARTEARV